MSCFKNNKAEKNFTELSEIFDNQQTATALITSNNGYSLEDNKAGEESLLFKQLVLLLRSKKKAFIIKSSIYNNTFQNEPSLNTVLGRDIKMPTKYTVDGMRRIVFTEASRLAKRISNKENVKNFEQADVLYSTNPTKTAGIINFYYKEDIAHVKDDYVVIKPTVEQLKKMVKVQLEKDYKSLQKEAAESVKQQAEEGNYDISPPYDDYNDYDLSDYEDSMSTKLETEFMNFKKFRKTYLQKLEERLNILKDKKRLVKDRETAKRVIKDIVEIRAEIDKVTKDIAKMTSEEAIVANIKEMANNDLRRAERLLSSTNGEDILQAKEIIDWYMLLGEFVEPVNHPFFGDNRAYTNREVKEKLVAIAELAKRLKVNLDERVRQETYKQLVGHRNYDKLGLDMTIDDLFNTQTPDIDVVSAWALNPNFTYNFTKNSSGDNLISQLMVEHFVGALSIKDGFAKNMTESIDALIPEVEKKLKGDYSIFYQKNADGNLTPYLIDAFSSAWFKLRSRINSRAYKDIQAAIASGGTNLGSAYRTKFKNIKKHADFLEIHKIPAIKQAFTGKIRTTFANDAESQAYEREIINRIGKNEYNRIVTEQIKLIDEYLIKTKLFVDGLLAFEQVDNIANLSQESKKKILLHDLSNNPFLVKDANDNGVISKTVNNNTLSSSANTEYIDYIPKELDTFGLMNKDFDQIRNDDTLYEFWNVISESLRYINNVLVNTGQQQITFNSLLEMNQSIMEDLTFKTKMPFGNRLKSIYNKLRDKWVKMITTGDNEFVQKDKENETKIDTSRLKSLRNKISSISSIDIQVAKKLIGIEEIKPNTRVLLNNKPELVNYLSRILDSKLMNRLASKGNRLQYGDITKAIYDQAEKQVMEQQSLDLPKVIKHYLTQAARIDASNETIPTLRIMKSLYKDLKTEDGEVRKHANERVERWYNRIVRGYFGVKGIPMRTKRLTRAEKVKLEKLKILLEKSTTPEEEIAVQEQIESLGNPINAMWVVAAFQSFIITWAMSYNIKSMALNRFHGYYQNAYFDNLGAYWTPGNDLQTSAFVLGKGRKNIFQLGKKLGTADVFGWENKAKQMGNAVLFMNKVGIIQDVRNEQQKASRKLGKETFSKKLNPFYLSITAVEWRNQSQTILNVLMDEKIEDSEGDIHPIFDGKAFTIYDNVNTEGVKVGEKYMDNGKEKVSKGGKLVLKDKFKYDKNGKLNTKNIDNWEKMTGSDFTAFKINAGNAVVAVHGDYSNTGGMAIKDSTMGKVSTTFLTFLPMLLHGRFGAGINLAAGTDRKKSVYKSMTATQVGFAGAMLGGSIFLPLAPVFGITGYLLKRKMQAPPDVGYAKELLATLKAFTFASMNIPIRIVSGKAIKHDIGKDLKLTGHDAAAARAVTFELAMVMQMMLMKVLAKSILYCEDDTELCKTKKAWKNWLANNLEMIISELLLPMNPLQVFETVTTGGAFLRILARAGVWIQAVTVALYDTAMGDDIEVITQGQFAGQSKLGKETRKLFLPSIAKAVGVYDDPMGTDQEYKNILTQSLGDDMVERLLKSDEERVKDYITSKRAAYRNKLREAGKLNDKEINKAVNRKYPTPKQVYQKFKRENKVTADTKYKAYITKTADSL